MPPGIDWATIRLAVFDMDGTLYRQRTLRLRMLRELLHDAAARRSLSTLRALSAYRRIREALAEEEVSDFEPRLIAATASATRMSEAQVRSLAAEWMERRPLRHLRRCIVPGAAALFAALSRQGIAIGVWSDYPAAAKLHALQLEADLVIDATDPAVRSLKPSPRGLEHLRECAGARADETVMIGDRVERDGEAARRSGVRALIRSTRPIPGWPTFARFDDAAFAPVLLRR